MTTRAKESHVDVAGTFVWTSECVAVKQALDMMLVHARRFRGLCMLLLGESGVGKSTVLAQLAEPFKVMRTEEGTSRPLVQCVVPTAPTAISFLEALLGELGDPIPSRGTRSQKKSRVLKLLREQNVVLLFLDEMQHFIDRDSDRILFDASECLKEILASYPMSVVFSGLEDAREVVRSNEQLMRRTTATVRLSRFNWSTVRSRQMFRGVLKAFGSTLAQYDMPPLDSEAMSLRFFLATGGIIDFISKIIAYAVSLADKAKSKKITLKEFSVAWKAVCFHADDEENDPFDEGYDPSTSEDLKAALNRALKINARVPRPTSARSRAQRLRRIRL